jgi:hypothetical protein
MFNTHPQAFTTALNSQRIAGMNRTQKQFSLKRAASKSNFLSVSVDYRSRENQNVKR